MIKEFGEFDEKYKKQKKMEKEKGVDKAKIDCAGNFQEVFNILKKKLGSLQKTKKLVELIQEK